MMDIHHGALDARISQPVENVIEQRPPAELYEGLRNPGCQGLHALAKPGG
jgi:hypothetical protein